MLKIGELARIFNLNTQTLRYYDCEGILCPEEIDKASGYRYYGVKQIETLNEIMNLKALGFELSEIKRILGASQADKLIIYQNKITALKAEANDKQENILQLERLCEGKSVMRDAARASLRNQLQALQFENDERAVGKWEYRGRCKRISKDVSKLVSKENLDTDNANAPKKLFFLPGGAYYWLFSWSKGILYRICTEHSLVIPNEYKIIEADKTYMLINWIEEECFVGDAKSYQLIYEKVDSKGYTDRETRVFCDDTDIPYVPDSSLVGHWSACALVKDISDFYPDMEFDPSKLHTVGLKVIERGICFKEMRGRKNHNEIQLRYSKGVIINDVLETVEHYAIKSIGERTYLFLEHKSGDYSYGGFIDVYYVFEKEK